MKRKLLQNLLFASLFLGFTSCDIVNNINVFTIEDDINLGKKVADEVEANPQYKVLDPQQYPKAYEHINRITNNILNAGSVQYRDQFVWQVKLIHDDEVLNAFCAPGGYIYVYTGLIKYLDNESQLAGVMAHEIAHAANRHTTDNMTKTYGLQLLLSVTVGEDYAALQDIATNLIGLGYSRVMEKEADEYSVRYLCGTEYEADGAAGFFEKIEKDGSERVPEFLSTHPNPENRVSHIHKLATELKCAVKAADKKHSYQSFKNSLP